MMLFRFLSRMYFETMAAIYASLDFTDYLVRLGLIVLDFLASWA